jgi:hypothetical protein
MVNKACRDLAVTLHMTWLSPARSGLTTLASLLFLKYDNRVSSLCLVHFFTRCHSAQSITFFRVLLKCCNPSKAFLLWVLCLES